MKVGVIDYGVGNVGSVLSTLNLLNVKPVLICDPNEMDTVDKLILPGVGNFKDCVELLNVGGWVQVLNEQVIEKAKPLLGICLGMQLLATKSMEGADDKTTHGIAGLNFIPGKVVNLQSLGCNLRIPHVGWNSVTRHPTLDQSFDGIPDGTDFYFVHSYAFVPDDPSHLLAVFDYGIPIVAAIKNGHIWGTQFHPEKSSRAGAQLLSNFINQSIC
jgi:glutamine amidotransferase